MKTVSQGYTEKSHSQVTKKESNPFPATASEMKLIKISLENKLLK